jgi:hypothetical protein
VRKIKQIIFAGIPVLLLVPIHLNVSAREPEAPVADTSGTIDFTLFSPSDPFIADTPLVINLEFDIREFIKNKEEEEYMPSSLYYTDHEGRVVEKEVRIKARGNFRKEHCSFPPIKLNLVNDETEDASSDMVKSVKLVTHCKNSRTYEQYLLKEFLVYRMYNLMTDYSYRVRLYLINYIDSRKKNNIYTRYGFIVEGDNHLASRLNAVEIEGKNLPSNLTDYERYHLMAVFQYMIGNTDWSVQAMHNIKLFKSLDVNETYPVAVPYDFDYSGMVNAFYAIPDEKLGIKSVRERVYRGYCIPEEDFIPIFQRFDEKKADLYDLVTDCDFLSNKHKQEMIAYLDEFYHILEIPRLREILIIKSCR